MNGLPKQPITFAEFELDPGRRQLRRGGRIVPLKARAFDVLLFLAENRGRPVAKEEILSAVWKESFVEEANLAVQISALRKALGDRKEAPRFLLTVPGKGYEFIADLAPDAAIVVEKHSFSRIVIEEPAADALPPPTGKTARRFALKYLAYGALSIIAGGALALAAVVGLRRARPETAPPKPLTITRLTVSGTVSAVAFTPAGDYVVFSQKEAHGESLWLRHIETGSQTRIAAPQRVGYLSLAVPPGGKFVYASVYLENRADPPVWKIPILGGAPEEIPNVVTAVAVGFSPDGRQMAYVESHRPETHLYVADADGANKRLVLSAHNDTRRFRFEDSNAAVWSPDGETLAVVFEERTAGRVGSGVLLVDPASGRERLLVPPRWRFVEYVAWLDAETLVFTGYEDEWTNQLYKVSRSTGEWRQITGGLQKYRWLAAAGGNLLTTQVSAVSTLYTAEFSETANSWTPRELRRESGYVSYVGFGRAGEIFYSSRATGKREIWRIEADGTNARPLTSGAEILYGLAVSPLDGRLLFPSNRSGKMALWTATADGQELRPAAAGGEEPIFPDIAPDGRVVFQDGDYKVALVSADGAARLVSTGGLKPVFSPDGRQIAFFRMEEGQWRIGLMTADTGEIVKMLDLPTSVKERRMRWHPSGKFLTLVFSTGEKLDLLLLPVDGGPPRIVENLGRGVINSFAWSADGRQILYSITDETQEAILLTDF